MQWHEGKCRKCITPLEGLPAESVGVSNESLGVENKFCYLGDIISAAVCVEESIVVGIRCGRKKFREFLPQR